MKKLLLFLFIMSITGISFGQKLHQQSSLSTTSGKAISEDKNFTNSYSIMQENAGIENAYTEPVVSYGPTSGGSRGPADTYIVLPHNGATSQNSRAPNNFWNFQRTEYLITASEMAASGFPSGSNISAIGFLVQMAGVGALNGTLNVWLKNTTDVTYTLGTDWITTGFTQVSSNGSFNMPVNGNYNISSFTSGAPFTYTGGGIYVAWEFSSPGGTIGTTVITHYCNNSLAASLQGGRSTSVMPTALGVASAFRPATVFSTTSETDILDVSNIYTHGKVPTPLGTPTPIAVRVVNSSASAATFDLTITVRDVTTSTIRYTSTQTGITLAAGVNGTTSFTGWIPTITEDVNVSASSSTAAGETFTLNNTLSVVSNVNTNLYSYTYGTPVISANYGFTFPGIGIFASKYTMNGLGTVTGANLFLSATNTVGNTISAVVLNSAGVIVAQSSTYTILSTDLGFYKNLSFPTPVAFNNEIFYVGLLSTAGAAQWHPFALSTEIPQRGSTFYTFSATGGTPSEFILNFKCNFEAQVVSFAGISAPSAFTATPFSTSQINLAWTPNINDDKVLVAWSSDGIFGTPVNGNVYNPNDLIAGGGIVLQNSTDPTFNHTSLAPGAHYYYKIWSGDGSVFSSGLTADAFTVCNPTGAPWSENFELTTFPPSCWTKTASPTWARSAACSGYGIGTASAKADFYNYSSPAPFDLISLPYSSGTLVSPQLKFDYAYAAYDDAGGPYVDQLDVYYSTNNGVSYTLLLAMPGGLTGILNTYGPTSLSSAFVPTAAQWASQSLSLPSGTNSIKFTATSAFGNNLYIDNVTVQEAPLCNVPTAIIASAVTQTTATISWTASSSNPTGGYQYEVRTSGAGGSGATGLVANGSTPAGDVDADITGLSANTDYFVYVRSDCGGSFSTWASGTFATPCNVIVAPFTETFETLPDCWTISGGAYNWAIVTGASGYGVGTGSANANFYNINNTVPFDLYTPVFDISTIVNPQLKFDFAYATYIDEVDKLDVYYSTNGGANYTLLMEMPGGTTGILNTGGMITSSFVPGASQWKTQLLTLPAGTNKIAFRAISAYGNNLFIDNVTVREAQYLTTFNLDMSTAFGFVPGTDVVYATGSFTGWAEPGNPGSIMMTQVGSTLIYTATTELLPGSYEYKYFKNAGWGGGEWASGPNRSLTVTASTSLNDTWSGSIGWANLQWPASGTVTLGGIYDVYAQVNIPNGITGAPGSAYGLQSWIGYSTSPTNPSTWTNWVPATFNTQMGDNDEFTFNLGSAIASPGTYYYASRFKFGNMPFVYGGFNGGFWDGTTNVSGVLTVDPPTTKTLAVKAFIQGFWNGTSMNQVQDADMDLTTFNKFTGTTADTLSVLLADAFTPFGYVFESHNVNINPDGTMTVSVPASLSGSYYIVIKQRNSVETWSATAVSFSGGIITYDFTTSASQAYGSNQIDLNGDGTVWGLYSGDITSSTAGLKDEYVDFFDLNEIFNLNLISAFGFQPADITGDGFVDFFDVNMVYNNNLNSVGMNTPPNPAKRPNAGGTSLSR